MQGYLKFKEVDEELYETQIQKKYEEKSEKFFYHILYVLIHSYLWLVVQIKKWFCIITVKEIYSGLIFILPFTCSQATKGSIKKAIPKLKKLMKRYEISTLVISENLKKDDEFLKAFQDKSKMDKKVHILNGKEIMPYLIKDIIEYILQKQDKNIELEDLHLLITQNKMEYKENIEFLAKYFKTINIITPYISNYQKIADELEKKYSALITVTNNKKKSLRKAKWIVNFDMPAKEMKKYTIYRSAAIIYLENSEIYEQNSFDGIHICKAGIDVSQEIKDFFISKYLINQCPITILYETTLFNNQSFLKIRKQMEKDKVRIVKLYGSKGELTKIDY